MKEDAQDCFHGMARLPAEGANRNDFNAVGIIDMHRVWDAHRLLNYLNTSPAGQLH
jgi:hypothetical protein